ncbi:MAG TPA: hypothetical protein VNV86_11290 [Candidatus Acidoferrum sp.]|jgi:hypothetical protein|nr:hypothetical protein [Candidatus Acidoferrum sp.]
MRLRAILLICLGFTLFAGQDAQLSPRFRTVYLTPMANEMDQHLASRLTSTRTLWVVLDPGSADAILTDSLDDGFWNWLSRTYPTPASATANRLPADRYGTQSSYRHRGTVFLVDPKTRLVLWSMYDLPRNFSPAELDRVAAHINTQLKAAFGKK